MSEDRKIHITRLLKDLELPYYTLTAWELSYIASVSDQFERSGRLSETQYDKLIDVHKRRCLQ